MPGSFTRDEYDRAKKLGRKLFGDQMNIFLDTDAGLWHFGRFLDNGPPISSKGNDPLGAPHRRPQEVFGVGATLTEAMAFVEGPKSVYSIPGVAPGAGGRGYRVQFDKRGRVHGYLSPAGIFSRNFPGSPGQWS